MYIIESNLIIFLLNSSFSVTNELVQPHLEGMVLAEALEKKRLFIVDYNLLDGIMPRQGYYVRILQNLVLYTIENKLLNNI